MLEWIIIPTLVLCAFIALANFAFSREPSLLKRLPKALECFLQQVILNIGCLVITMLLVVGLVAAALTLFIMRLWS